MKRANRMKITVELILPSLKPIGKDYAILAEGYQMLVTALLEKHYKRDRLLLTIGDGVEVPHSQPTVYPFRFVVSERNIQMAQEAGSPVWVHFVLTELPVEGP